MVAVGISADCWNIASSQHHSQLSPLHKPSLPACQRNWIEKPITGAALWRLAQQMGVNIKFN